MSNQLIIGAHVSLSAPDYFVGSVKDMLSYGANTMMFYTGAPQNSKRMPLDIMKIDEGKALLDEHNINPEHLIVHAPYIINIGNTIKPDLFDVSLKFLRDEMTRVAEFGAKVLVLHPGAHVGAGVEEASKQIITGINEILRTDQTGTIIALETMAGKGTEVGRNFEEIAQLIAGIERKEQIGVCLDTCHINDAGYDVHQVDAVLAEFDRIIGLKYLKVIHINDSKNDVGAHKDRHDNLGYGTIGFATLVKYFHHPLLTGIPKILETPWFNDRPPDKKEISMVKKQRFEPNWRENL